MVVPPIRFVEQWDWQRLPRPKNMAIADASYFCPTRDMVNNELYPNFKKWLSSINLGKWYHKWDCDNFADAFKVFCNGYYFNHIESDAESIAVGIVHYIAEHRAENGLQGAHAGNVIYLDEGNNNLGFSYFEPQNGKLYNFSQNEFRSIKFLYV